MIREAGLVMAAEGFDFVFTGEVLGQRPMSQNRGSLNLVARESGLAELLLRPLSAKLLKTTRPELEGWVDRERLLNLSGRGRKRQIALAAEYGITRYPAPAGGCLLTDPGYALRIKELLRHQERAVPPGPGAAEVGPPLPPARRRQGGGGPHPAGQRGHLRPESAGGPLLEGGGLPRPPGPGAR